MERKVTKCSFLYVAPEGADINVQKRWQRRWFYLFDNGELTYAIDHDRETVPQGHIDLLDCTSVSFLDQNFGHSNALEITLEDGRRRIFVKADTNDEIRRWHAVLALYASRTTSGGSNATRTKSVSGQKQPSVKPPASPEAAVSVVSIGENGTMDRPTLATPPSGANEPQRQPPSVSWSVPVALPVDGGVDQVVLRRTASASSSASKRRLSEPLAAATIDVNRLDSFHGTPRSVKQRNRKTSQQQDQRRSMVEINETDSQISNHSDHMEDVRQPLVLSNSGNTVATTPQQQMHTVRKGWLMVRGKADADWHKHWVVLAGLSLRLYRDTVAEERAEPNIVVDLDQCINVYPTSVNRNYGIEIRCYKNRVILSAMTPGIRDSWVAAMQQNIRNPSPPSSHTDDTNNNTKTTINGDGTAHVSAVVVPNGNEHGNNASTARSKTKKHTIAYVPPESHHRHADEPSSSCSEHEDEHQHQTAADEEAAAVDREIAAVQLLTSHGRKQTSRRRTSSSPTVRRSPVSRVKERSAAKQQRSTAGNSGTAASDDRQMSREEIDGLMKDLAETQNRLDETERENSKLRQQALRNQSDMTSPSPMFVNGITSSESEDRRPIAELRANLTTAEIDVLTKREEIELLSRQLLDDDEQQRENGEEELTRSTPSDTAATVASSSVLDSQTSTQRDLVDAETMTATDGVDSRPQQFRSCSMDASASLLELLGQEVDFLRALIEYEGRRSVDLFSPAFSENVRSLVDGLESLVGSVPNGSAINDDDDGWPPPGHHHHPPVHSSLDSLNELIFNCRRRLSDATSSLTTSLHAALENGEGGLLPVERRVFESPKAMAETYSSTSTISNRNENGEGLLMTVDVGTSCTLMSVDEYERRDAQELEQELLEMQASHQDDLDQLRSDYEQQLVDLKAELTAEGKRRRKLQTDVETMKKMQDQSLELLQRSHQELMNGLHAKYETDIGRLQREHETELYEEKEATRKALDAVQRAFETQLRERHDSTSTVIARSGSTIAIGTSNPTTDKKHMSMLEQMSKELSQLSAAYSAKCVENSQIEEGLVELKHKLRFAQRSGVLPNGVLSGDEEEEEEDAYESEELSALRQEVTDLRDEVDFLREKLAAQNFERNPDISGDRFSPKEDRTGVSRPNVQFRRTDDRYHSSPHVVVMAPPNPHPPPSSAPPMSRSLHTEQENRRWRHTVTIPADVNQHNASLEAMERRGSVPEHLLKELKGTLSVPVSERRKFFESLGNLTVR